MAFLEIKSADDVVHMHYEVTGGNLPVLVLSNSLGTDVALWEAQMDAFSSRFRVLRYDSRGHGETSTPPGPYTVDQLGQDVLHLLDKLSLERVHFCGVSLGGVVGQWLGVHAPQRLHKLVLCSTAAKIGTKQSWNARIDSVVSGGMQPIVPSVLERWYTPGFISSLPDRVASTGEMLRRTSAAGYAATCAALRDADQRQSVGGILSPTLVVAGKHDPVTPPSDCQWLKNAIPGALYLELEASHLCNVEAAVPFNTAVVDFLSA